MAAQNDPRRIRLLVSSPNHRSTFKRQLNTSESGYREPNGDMVPRAEATELRIDSSIALSVWPPSTCKKSVYPFGGSFEPASRILINSNALWGFNEI